MAEENPNREVKSWMEWFKKTGNPIHRVYPARLAILSNPKIKKSDLLWHEDMEQIFQRAEIIISGPCGCRSGAGMGESQASSLRIIRGPGATIRCGTASSSGKRRWNIPRPRAAI